MKISELSQGNTLQKSKLSSRERSLVKISHSQVLKQSHAYQSIEASYGIEIQTKNDPESISKAVKRAEAFVEKRLVKKMTQQRRFLEALAAKNS